MKTIIDSTLKAILLFFCSTLTSFFFSCGHMTISGIEFVWVSEGCFRGYEHSGPEICVDGFWMSKYELTQKQWAKITKLNPSTFKLGGDYPIETVSWNDVKGYIAKLNEISGNTYRLPTEAEWEYACRANTPDRFQPWVGEMDCHEANYGNYKYGDEKCKGINPGRTKEVGSYKPNKFGLYDMYGNVSEWCEDVYSVNTIYIKKTNDSFTETESSYRIHRGGAWHYSRNRLKPNDRQYFDPDTPSQFIGFRLCISKITNPE